LPSKWNKIKQNEIINKEEKNNFSPSKHKFSEKVGKTENKVELNKHYLM
jgi:hypothetical protein